ncbi:MAG: hypothetical protein QXO21_06545 [Candidatus Anstonellales archaeon]
MRVKINSIYNTKGKSKIVLLVSKFVSGTSPTFLTAIFDQTPAPDAINLPPIDVMSNYYFVSEITDNGLYKIDFPVSYIAIINMSNDANGDFFVEAI